MEPPASNFPPNYGKRLIPVTVDEVSKSDGGRPFVSIPRSPSLQNGYVDVSYEAYAKAVNRCSWWIERTIGRSNTSKVIFYLGPLDIRYLVILLAAAKTGHVAFFSSHRNSLKAHLSLLEASQCHTILIPDGAPAVVKRILAARPMQAIPMPCLESFFASSDKVADYPFLGAFDEVKDKTFVILHTSGSTGIPKPVFVTHGTFAGNDAHQLIPSLGGKPTMVDYIKGKRMFVAFPLFHAANLGIMALNVFAGATCVLPPPGPLTSDTVDMVHTHGNLHGSLIPSSMIVDIYNNPGYLANMVRQLEFVAYVGGTLAADVGDYLSTRIKLITLMGTTENMYLPIEVDTHCTDWQYIPISPFLGHIFRPSIDGLDELVVVRNEKYSLFQGVFSTFPERNEYPTSDLFEPHPSKQGYWRFRGRSDDIICFNNAEKLNPVTMETVISAHPKIKSAVIGGNGQFQASLLIEPRIYPETPAEAGKFIDDVWPIILKANEDCPSHGRIMRDFIMLTDPEKPIPRAGKDSVQRYATLKLYSDEFKAIYKKPARSGERKHVPVLGPSKVVTPGAVSEENRSDTANSTTKSQAAVLDAQPEFDVRVEVVLRRLLPNVLAQHLGQALGQMVSNLLQPPPTHAKPTMSSSGYSSLADDIMYPATSNEAHGAPASTASEGPLTNGIPHEPFAHTLKEALYQAISETTYLYNVTDEANLFDCGLDSIQVTALVRRINAYLVRSRPSLGLIQSTTVYENPSLVQLVNAIECSA